MNRTCELIRENVQAPPCLPFEAGDPCCGPRVAFSLGVFTGMLRQAGEIDGQQCADFGDALAELSGKRMVQWVWPGWQEEMS